VTSLLGAIGGLTLGGLWFTRHKETPPSSSLIGLFGCSVVMALFSVGVMVHVFWKYHPS